MTISDGLKLIPADDESKNPANTENRIDCKKRKCISSDNFHKLFTL